MNILYIYDAEKENYSHTPFSEHIEVVGKKCHQKY